MTVIEMLERLRAYGLSDTRVARELGMCPSSVHKLRRGRIKNPLHSTVRGIELLYQIVLTQAAFSTHSTEEHKTRESV